VFDHLRCVLPTRTTDAAVAPLLTMLVAGNNDHSPSLINPRLSHVDNLSGPEPQATADKDDEPGFQPTVVIHFVCAFEQQLELSVVKRVVFRVMYLRCVATLLMAASVRTHASSLEARSGAPTPGHHSDGNPRSRSLSAVQQITPSRGVKV